MRRNLSAAAVLVLSMTGGGMLVGTSPASAAGPTGCPTPKAMISESDVLELASSSCDLTGDTVDLGASGLVVVPTPGTGLEQSTYSVTSAGDEDIVIFQSSNHSISLEVNGAQVGSSSALPSVLRAAKNLVGASAPVTATTTRCSSAAASAFATEGGRWLGTFDWWYNNTNSEGSSIARIQAAMSTWQSGTNSCGLATGTGVSAAYKGTNNSYAPAVNPNDTCPSSGQGHSVVGWGLILSSSVVALSCIHMNALGFFTESDTKLNTNITFYLGSSTTGCSGVKYDLQYTMTHEFGHALGLDHSPQSYEQTMMPAQGRCYTTGRALGRGDLAGIRSIYGS